MKAFLVMFTCISLFMNCPAKTEAVLDKPLNALSVIENTNALQKNDKIGSTELLDGKKPVAEDKIKNYDSQDIDLLARLVHAEAKGEPYKGKVAVAATVLNRVENPAYPDTIRDVIYEYNHGFQYCPVGNGQINLPADKIAYEAVKEALHGNDPTGGALSFYNPAKPQTTGYAAGHVVAKIGNHIFVK